MQRQAAELSATRGEARDRGRVLRRLAAILIDGDSGGDEDEDGDGGDGGGVADGNDEVHGTGEGVKIDAINHGIESRRGLGKESRYTRRQLAPMADVPSVRLALEPKP